MKNYYKIQDQASEADGGGAPKEVPPATPPASDPAVKAEGAVTDEFGYEKAPAQDDPTKKADPKVEEKKAGEKIEEVKDPATGYGVKPPETKVEEKKVDPPPAKDLKEELGYELDLKDLEKAEADKLTEFVKTHKLSKEVAEAYVNNKKSEIAAFNQEVEDYRKNQEKVQNETRANWDKELREDKTFGGQNYERNIHRVEKLMAEFMPLTKKVLTERKGMLPPNVMRDLCKLADHLYNSDKIVQGDPKMPEKTQDKEMDPLDFYQ